MSDTRIEWADVVWNYVTGCTKLSKGCDNCYAERMARRLAGRFGYPSQDGGFRVTIHADRLRLPSTWKKGRRVFVNSMGDLFHKDVPVGTLNDIFEEIENCATRADHTGDCDHQFFILTKRPDRAFSYLHSLATSYRIHGINPAFMGRVWIGVSVEDMDAKKARMPWLENIHNIGFFKTFVSAEPLLGPIHFTPNELSTIEWLICGPETGPKARKMDLAWVRLLRSQVRSQVKGSAIPFFFKKQKTLGGEPCQEFPNRKPRY